MILHAAPPADDFSVLRLYRIVSIIARMKSADCVATQQKWQPTSPQKYRLLSVVGKRGTAWHANLAAVCPDW